MNDDQNQTNTNPDMNPDKRPDMKADISTENSAHLRDLLISRVIDGSASPEDWSSFRILAASDAEVWTDLSDAQREHEALCEVMHAATAIADGIDLPGGSGSPLVFESRVTLAARWGGWAIAAVVLLGWFTGMISMNPNSPMGGVNNGGFTAGMIPLGDANTDQAFGRYLQAGQTSGQVVGEMPDQIVVETRPLDDGTIEVIFLRQVIERRVLEQAYREAVDDSGNRVVVPLDLEQLKRSNAF